MRLKITKLLAKHEVSTRSCCDLDLQGSDLNVARDTLSRYVDHICEKVLKSNFKLWSYGADLYSGPKDGQTDGRTDGRTARRLYAPSEVILKLYKSNINSLSKKDKSILVQTFVYVLLSNLLIFGQTIDVSLIKL